MKKSGPKRKHWAPNVRSRVI